MGAQFDKNADYGREKVFFFLFQHTHAYHMSEHHRDCFDTKHNFICLTGVELFGFFRQHFAQKTSFYRGLLTLYLKVLIFDTCAAKTHLTISFYSF